MPLLARQCLWVVESGEWVARTGQIMRVPLYLKIVLFFILQLFLHAQTVNKRLIGTPEQANVKMNATRTHVRVDRQILIL